MTKNQTSASLASCEETVVSKRKTAESLLAPHFAVIKEVLAKFTPQIFELYLRDAQQGAPLAQLLVGECYYYGIAVRKDFRQAVEFYKLAAEENIAEANYRLGMCLRGGTGIEMNAKKADKMFQNACKPRASHYSKNNDLLYSSLLNLTRKFSPHPYFYSDYVLDACPNCGATEGKHYDYDGFNICVDCGTSIFHHPRFTAPNETNKIFYTFLESLSFLGNPSGYTSVVVCIAVDRQTLQAEAQATINVHNDYEIYRMSYAIELTDAEIALLNDSSFQQAIVDISKAPALSQEEKEARENARMSDLFYDTFLMKLGGKTYSANVDYFYRKESSKPCIDPALKLHGKLWYDMLLPRVWNIHNIVSEDMKRRNIQRDGSNVEL